ncbi:MAG: dienelactone hydrolase family protein [Sulfurifustis sp.]
MQRYFAALLLSCFLFQPVWAAVKGQEVEYKAGDTVLKGYIAYDDAVKTKRPAVLVVHEWWGHDKHARNSARKLAEAGFVGFALDMYGEGKQAHHPKDAGEMSGQIRKNLPLMQARFDAARDYLGKQPMVDPAHIGVIGYCFGGAVALDMARQGEDLPAVVTFHGVLGTEHPAQSGKIKGKVLVLTGADDPFVPKQQVEGFEQEMKSAGADYKVIAYPGAKHAFTNPAATANGKKFNLPLEYNAQADKQSWSEAIAFLKRTLM